MRGRNPRRSRLALKRAAERFAGWRRTRELGTRIPESLWKLAVRFARTHGVCQTALLLRLDYYSLKRRLEAQGPPPTLSRRSSDRPSFVELPPAALRGSSECVLELENIRGAKMRVHVKGFGVSDLAALGRTLWDMS